MTAIDVVSVQSWPSGKLVDEGTPEYENETRAGRYADNEVLCCDSALMEFLMTAQTAVEESGGGVRGSGFSIEDMENLYPDPNDWTIGQCKEWLNDHLGSYIIDPSQHSQALSESEWQEAVRDNAEPAEVMEWWRVTDWLCGQLRDIGEVVIDNDYGCWWGRQCTGQGFRMDGTLQQIARKFA
jgi:hypothetical protein